MQPSDLQRASYWFWAVAVTPAVGWAVSLNYFNADTGALLTLGLLPASLTVAGAVLAQRPRWETLAGAFATVLVTGITLFVFVVFFLSHGLAT